MLGDIIMLDVEQQRSMTKVISGKDDKMSWWLFVLVKIKDLLYGTESWTFSDQLKVKFVQ